jgi:hypothetical protein
MFRHFWFAGTGVLALYGMLGAPGQLAAQHARGGSTHGLHSDANGFNARFRGRFSDPRFTRGRFDRFEDHFENRFRFGGFDPRFGFGPRFDGLFDPRFTRGRFDRFENHFENRFRFGGFDPGIRGLALGFGFIPGIAGGFVPGIGFAPGFFGLVFP